MADISLVEFIVFGLIAYSSILMLIISMIIKPPAATNKLTLIRSAYMIPGIIAAIILAGSGVNVITNDQTTTNTIVAVNQSEVFTESYNIQQQIVLQNPVWVSFHFLLAIVMSIYVIQQILMLLASV